MKNSKLQIAILKNKFLYNLFFRAMLIFVCLAITSLSFYVHNNWTMFENVKKFIKLISNTVFKDGIYIFLYKIGSALMYILAIIIFFIVKEISKIKFEFKYLLGKKHVNKWIIYVILNVCVLLVVGLIVKFLTDVDIFSFKQIWVLFYLFIVLFNYIILFEIQKYKVLIITFSAVLFYCSGYFANEKIYSNNIHWFLLAFSVLSWGLFYLTNLKITTQKEHNLNIKLNPVSVIFVNYIRSNKLFIPVSIILFLMSLILIHPIFDWLHKISEKTILNSINYQTYSYIQTVGFMIFLGLYVKHKLISSEYTYVYQKGSNLQILLFTNIVILIPTLVIFFSNFNGNSEFKEYMVVFSLFYILILGLMIMKYLMKISGLVYSIIFILIPGAILEMIGDRIVNFNTKFSLTIPIGIILIGSLIISIIFLTFNLKGVKNEK